MTFFIQTVPDPDRAQAGILLGILRKHRKLFSPNATSRSWGMALKKHRAENNLTITRIEAALVWYAANFGKLRIYSPQSLCRQTVVIEALMAPKICQEVEAVLARTRLRWPRDSGPDAPVMAQLTYDNHQAFKRKLTGSGFPEYLLSVIGGESEHFTEVYLEKLNIRLWAWPSWSGGLVNMAWKASSKAFQVRARQIAREWGDEKAWEKIQ